MVSAPGRRAQVAYAKKRGLSKRRACALLDVARSGLDRESVRDKQDEPVIARLGGHPKPASEGHLKTGQS